MLDRGVTGYLNLGGQVVIFCRGVDARSKDKFLDIDTEPDITTIKAESKDYSNV